MWNRRVLILFFIFFINVFMYGDSTMNKLEEIKIGTSKSEIFDEFGKPDFFGSDTNLINIVYKVSEEEYYKLYFTYNQKIWKLCKIIKGKESIIFMDTRVK